MTCKLKNGWMYETPPVLNLLKVKELTNRKVLGDSIKNLNNLLLDVFQDVQNSNRKHLRWDFIKESLIVRLISPDFDLKKLKEGAKS